MGDAPLPNPVIVLAFFREIPPAFREAIQNKFPDANLEALVLQRGEPIPTDVSRKATVIVTFTNLPTPEDAAHIKVIHFLSAGLDHLIHHPVLTQTSIPVTTSSGIHGPPIAEWTIMNWLVASKKYARSYENQKTHTWGSHDAYMDGLHDQVGKKVGILGYGSIGRQIGRVCAAMGMTVHAYTASPRTTPASRRDPGYIVPGTGDKDGTVPVSWHHGTDRASLHAFLALGLDHVVVCLPLTPQTTHMLGADEFALLSARRRTPHIAPYLTNISRGKVIDQAALLASLASGELRGAALDVTDPEPLPGDHPLWEAPNVQISPHVSGLGEEYFPRSLDILRENLGRLERGEALINEYKRGKGY
ncbi:hypothetical protein P175DRAFT_0497100 [Aspergillus ochraceoroseus IBT 24754]|uniref:D-isomer specific 2-hydroxyacid dehydrogenase NAD-binding domain-containing protein n=2 Tax=Aspergillus ochraceoroseus TaxID=138278 RepID=A0A2T5M618_9EURO|nr:uncharacterized protein P175DRAFT_0497100 [Aspergillus ochraceoroseus IBT 24754]KKK12615.1 hypothetical protein AOCH_002311 [Aspergillus ochraceoroseus]PTU23974.1 hypothetical protein P175DRAFT_0497100 [Aspergillus ochraceoroseus IBT 24754]